MAANDNKVWDVRASAVLGVQLAGIVALLWCFLFGLDVMSTSFKILAGEGAGNLFGGVAGNPISGLMVGIVATVLLQSSSTTTSIVVTMVGAGLLDVQTAIPVVMGANIGTSVTNTLVSLGYATDAQQYQRAFAGATVHDLFNYLSVLVLLPLELVTSAFNGGGGGLLFVISDALTSSLASSQEKGDKWEGPVKVLVSPYVKKLVRIDKKVITDYSVGFPDQALCSSYLCPEQGCAIKFNTKAPSAEACLGYGPCVSTSQCAEDAKLKIQYCNTDANGTYTGSVNEECMGVAQQYFNNFKIVVGGSVYDSGLSDHTAGALLLVLSLVMLCVCLFAIIKLLERVVGQFSESAIKKAFNMNQYLAMIVGAGVTILVQSSSITTSTLVPLVGVGALTLEGMLPLTLGANIGTTATALMASLVSDKRQALQIALCHLFFNIFGILIWFPIPRIRALPLEGARKLGSIASKYRWFPIVYTLSCFVVFPLVLLGVSSTFEKGTMGVVGGCFLVFFLVLAAGGVVYFFKHKNGEEWLNEKLSKTRFGGSLTNKGVVVRHKSSGVDDGTDAVITTV